MKIKSYQIADEKDVRNLMCMNYEFAPCAAAEAVNRASGDIRAADIWRL